MGRTAGDYHGTFTGYYHHGCRLDCCVEANRQHQREQTAKRSARPIPDHVHGTEAGYANYRCRCERCKGAHSVKQAEYRRRRKAST